MFHLGPSNSSWWDHFLGLFVHAITASYFITNISWLVFQYPVVAARFPDVVEHKMFWKTFRLLIFEDGSCPWGRLRRTLPKVQTFAGPCCSSFLMFRVVDFFFLFPRRRLPAWWLYFALILVFYWASFQICFGVEMLAGLLGFIPSLARASRKHGLFSLMLKPRQ